MPLHDFQCPAGHVTEMFVGQGVDWVACEVCGSSIGATAKKVFLKPPMGFVQADVCYDSPIDGRPITSRQARIEDMKRNDCIEYDPEMKKDAAQRIKDKDAALERAVDYSVDAAIAAMPARKREKLEAEMTAGLTAVPERGTANFKPVTVGVNNG